MPHTARRRGRPATATLGLELSAHEDCSQVLSIMAQQAKGLRALVRQATGRSSAPGQAAHALWEAVQRLQAALLADLDARYGDDAAPWSIRTRYSTRG